jgi:hypothetical protein
MTNWILMMSRRGVACALIAGLLGSSFGLANGNEQEVVTQASRAQVLLQSSDSAVVNLRLQGVVYGVDSSHHAFQLRDDFGFVWLEMGAFKQPIESGMELAVEGTGVLGNRHAFLGYGPVVDNDGWHAVVERAGTMFLEPGKHPFELDYFQRISTGSLDLFYEGPGISRTNIPSTALFYRNKGESDSYLPGVQYDYFEGSWEQLPDFGQLTPQLSGITTNISITPSPRDTNYALRFTGYIDIPRRGVYRFILSSDDGSRLFISYASSNEVKIVGRKPPCRRLAKSH